ncbi:hypothetical protein LOK49_LG02G00306 [Camellia lanceoleosa]|uniref:Uncharacterized protein n=1 Tax=Camellia lanceoleosa TaxID=1840588 RepID=A0ACC0ILW7_9ERIC|nr:hypothetical protein LOK49_LG02G00306 [Camellia lanceoleosa]
MEPDHKYNYNYNYCNSFPLADPTLQPTNHIAVCLPRKGTGNRIFWHVELNLTKIADLCVPEGPEPGVECGKAQVIIVEPNDLMDKKQHISILTTVSLPWMTGTAVNPLFRAAFLAKDEERKVTLVIPWLSLKDQERVYPDKITFNLPAELEKYVCQWLEDWTGLKSSFNIRFYPGKFSSDKRSILAVGDITEAIPDEEADIAVLGEPEHLTWYHHGKRWKTKFRLVVGVVHTNYLEYVRREKNGQLQGFFLKYINSWVVDIYCHKDLPRSIICNIHGVYLKFLEIGKKKNEEQQNGNRAFTKGAYYIGKMVWSKGYKQLLKLLRDHQKDLSGVEVDLYGNGEDYAEVQSCGSLDIEDLRKEGEKGAVSYLITTDVVCTTSAEALAMGKIVVCANHPSNEFFKQFLNCQTYEDGEGFLKATHKALTKEPAPVTDTQRHKLSWEAATERFLRAAELDKASPKQLTKSPSKLFMSMSIDLRRNMEDASVLVHYVGTGFLSVKLNQDQCKELGLASPLGNRGS